MRDPSRAEGQPGFQHFVAIRMPPAPDATPTRGTTEPPFEAVRDLLANRPPLRPDRPVRLPRATPSELASAMIELKNELRVTTHQPGH